MTPETQPKNERHKMNAQELIAKANDITIINDGQVQYPVLTSDLAEWTEKNGAITSANYEKFCDEVENLGEPTALTGDAKMIELCDSLVEAGAATERLG